MKDVVNSANFDMCSGLAVIVNAAWIGIQTEAAARSTDDCGDPDAFVVIDALFCIGFTTELIFRLIADGKFFLSKPGWSWNAFDLLLVLFQITEWFISRLVSSCGGQSANFSFMRILRILRLIRVIRLVRIIRLIGELKTIVAS